MARGFETYGTGVGDKIELNHSIGTAFTALTLSSWMYVHTAGNYEEFLATPNSGVGNDYRFTLYGTNRIRFWSPFTLSKGDWRSVANIYASDTWFHFALTYDATNVANDPIVYVNGSVQAFDTDTNPTGVFSATSGNWRMGSGLDGMLAEFALYNRVLTADEVIALAKGYSPSGLLNGLQMYYPCVRELNGMLPNTAPTNTGTVVQNHPRVFYPAPRSVGVPSAAAPITGSPWYHYLQQAG